MIGRRLQLAKAVFFGEPINPEIKIINMLKLLLQKALYDQQQQTSQSYKSSRYPGKNTETMRIESAYSFYVLE